MYTSYTLRYNDNNMKDGGVCKVFFCAVIVIYLINEIVG